MSNLALRLERSRTSQFAGGCNEADNVGAAIGFATDVVDPGDASLNVVGAPTVNNGIGGAGSTAVEVATGQPATHVGKNVQVQAATGSTAPDAQLGTTGYYNRSSSTLSAGQKVLGTQI